MRRSFAFLVAVVVILAAAARLLQCGEGLPYLHTWDEPYTASQALHMMQTGALNPDFFNYGSVTIYLCLIVDVAHYFYLMGQPESAPASLAKLDDIRTRFQTDWFWTISHPSFYFWNRCLIALLGTATVLLVYCLGRRVAGRWGGVAAAAALAGLEIHVEQSALVTVDIPASFFVVLAAWLSVLYLEEERPALLTGALAACGIAISTKYNAALSLSMPLLALAVSAWRSSPGYRRWLWIALAIVPVAAFLAGTPYAVLDLPRFLDGAGGELRHYRILGHGNETVTAGWPHLGIEFAALAGNLGVPASALALVGAAAMLSRRIGGPLVAYPLLHVLFMAGTRVFFPRNLVVVYPFAAVAFGAGAVFLWRRLHELRERRGSFRLAAPAFALVVAALLADGMGVALARSWEAGTTPESRTTAMGRVASIAGAEDRIGVEAARIGIAEELLVHEDDLRRLGGRAEVRPYLHLICHPEAYRLVVTPDSFAGLLAKFVPAAQVMSAAGSGRLRVRERVGEGNATYLDRYSVNPAVRIFDVEAAAHGRGACVDSFDPGDLSMSPPYELDDRGALEMIRKGSVATPWVSDGAGTHAFLFRALGKWGAGEYPSMKVTARRYVEGSEPVALARKTFELTWARDPYALIFELPEGALVSLKVDYLNGSESEAPPGHRKVALEPITLLRLP
jgi:4-amino-4-deoxy-L-arabinose transferase-like glycosyltransferase